MAKASKILTWPLIGAAFIQIVFVTVPFFVQGIYAVEFADLVEGRPTYSLLGDYGYAVALVSQTFGYSLLLPLVLISIVLAVFQRKWQMVALDLSSLLPWLVLLPYHSRLVEWLWP